MGRNPTFPASLTSIRLPFIATANRRIDATAWLDDNATPTRTITPPRRSHQPRVTPCKACNRSAWDVAVGIRFFCALVSATGILERPTGQEGAYRMLYAILCY